ncbi:acyltransferase [Prevotella sp. E2-28]|jgi:acetyltransferase-like isoleucine patch superfamily enzyme|uniref:acyltransferase n=1 Tax=Prevotella sp. E2-28 TaxID=2913620 RepID=UPI001EDC5B68|nr:acyltransferase [Prevotella sp. E2-28]UKK53537.1 N-acetyltransferase [Prevotella sp. E2-28]
MANRIHQLADCMSPFIGDDTNIWQFCVIFPEAHIGNHCNVCANVIIENDVVVGDNVTIKSGVQLWDGITLEDNVFVGPNVTFTNDQAPRSKNKSFVKLQTIVRKGASIGANSTIVGGIEIGAYAMVGVGSVVTHNIPAHALCYGNPARQMGFVTRSGLLLDMDYKDKEGVKHDLDE